MKNIYTIVTIAIPSKNSETNISNALESVKKFKNVFVIDSNSTDKTPEIAKNYNANLVKFTWNGKYPKKRNWFLEEGYCKTEWVLFLDCDEVLTQGFIDELESKIEGNKFNGFILSYTNYFMDRALKFGIPFKKLAIFKPAFGKYQKIQENEWSSFDMEVHEHPEVNGDIGMIKSRIKHFDFRGIEHHLAKHHGYAKFEAQNYLEKSYLTNELTIRQKIKYKLLGALIFPFAYFFIDYIVLLGFLNGRPGYVFSISKFFYFLEVYIRIKSDNQLVKKNN